MTAAALVLKTDKVEAVVAHLEMMGLRFKEKQHGASPIHYACEVDGVVLEIYPGGPNGRVSFWLP